MKFGTAAVRPASPCPSPWCGASGRGGFDCLSEESAWIFWCSDGKFPLEAPDGTDLVHKGQILP